MKKFFLVIVFVFFGVLTTQAQWYIGGSANASLNKDFKSFTIAPDFGYYMSNAPFAIGCAVEYEGALQKGEDYYHALTLSPYFRYDICDIGERFSLFTDLIFDFDVLEFSFFDIGLCPGISFDLTEHWSAEFNLGFLGYEWEKVSDDKPSQNIVLNFETVAPSFGIFYSF